MITLQKIAERGYVSIGHRETSVPFSYIGDAEEPIGYSIDLCHNIVDSDEFMIEKMSTGDHPLYWRMCGGVCGWGPGQLQAEVEGSLPHTRNKGWLTIPTNDRILFEYDGDEQWVQALDLASQQMVDQYF